MGLGKDTHTSPSQFSNLALSFWVSYLACEPLTGYLLQKLPVGKFLAVNGMSLNKTIISRLNPRNSNSMGPLCGPQLRLQELCIPGRFASPSGGI